MYGCSDPLTSLGGSTRETLCLHPYIKYSKKEETSTKSAKLPAPTATSDRSPQLEEWGLWGEQFRVYFSPLCSCQKFMFGWWVHHLCQRLSRDSATPIVALVTFVAGVIAKHRYRSGTFRLLQTLKTLNKCVIHCVIRNRAIRSPVGNWNWLAKPTGWQTHMYLHSTETGSYETERPREIVQFPHATLLQVMIPWNHNLIYFCVSNLPHSSNVCDVSKVTDTADSKC